MVALLFALFAVASAVTSTAYHRALAGEHALRAANLGLLVDVLNAAPVLTALTMGPDDGLTAFVGDWAGGWLGVLAGVVWARRTRKQPIPVEIRNCKGRYKTQRRLVGNLTKTRRTVSRLTIKSDLVRNKNRNAA